MISRTATLIGCHMHRSILSSTKLCNKRVRKHLDHRALNRRPDTDATRSDATRTRADQMERSRSLTWYDDALCDAWDTFLLDIVLKMICGMICTSTGYDVSIPSKNPAHTQPLHRSPSCIEIVLGQPRMLRRRVWSSRLHYCPFLPMNGIAAARPCRRCWV